WHKRPQLWRNDRDNVENHPLRLVAGLPEALNNPETLRELQLLLSRSFGPHLLADFLAERFDVELAKEFLHALGTHHGHVAAGELLIQLALALIADHFARRETRAFARIDDNKRF